MQDAFDDFFRAVTDYDRNGIVSAVGYTDSGDPIGGHYTADAVAGIASAYHDLSERTGLDYDWLRATV